MAELVDAMVSNTIAFGMPVRLRLWVLKSNSNVALFLWPKKTS
jgi:hypothetical protein